MGITSYNKLKKLIFILNHTYFGNISKIEKNTLLIYNRY